MKSNQIQPKRIFVIRLERGEEVIASISNFCKQNKIEGGTVQGIGALSEATLYSVKNSEKFIFNEETVNQPMELVSASGNIAVKDGEPLIHMHVCLGLSNHTSKTGHLLRGTISFTGEFFIFETEKLVKKKEGELNQFQL
ncbi:DNA-binding protein [Candidatus Micrarchaeota archaeon]|nr:DNA-binding protein [Candidatus Micrarchaeota archaeon]